MRILNPFCVFMAAAVLCTSPAMAQFKGGVYVSAGDVNGSAAPLSVRAPGIGGDFEISKVTFGAKRSLQPPTSRGPGTAQITLKRGQSAAIGQWFARKSRQSAGQDGADLLIMNNGEGFDFYKVVFTDLIISSYQTGGAAADSTATIKYSKITVHYTTQGDDHSAD